MSQSQPTGFCPVCQRPFRLRVNGTVWNHRNGIKDWSSGSYGLNCSGAGQKPTTTED